MEMTRLRAIQPPGIAGALLALHSPGTRMRIRGFLLLISVLTLAACGGGGSDAAAPAATGPQAATVAAPQSSPPPPSTNSADLVLADRLYKGDARTPSGFELESRPANVVGTVSTRHLKNTD